jgi:hypothetical protein
MPPAEAGAAFFSPDYLGARERFRGAARAAGAHLDALAIEARGPGQEPLTIDIARLGAPAARNVLVHTSGMHGVEAFAGAAVQLAALAHPPAVPEGCALVLAHVLNPYGMAWLRRANENNVDLNRNFLPHGERWEGAPTLYPRLDALINPPTPPAADGFDRAWKSRLEFRLRLAGFALRYGLRAPRQAIAEGQYEFPRGLFYGGRELEAGPRRFLEWLRRELKDTAYLFAVDLHTGLGRRGAETVILEPGVGATPVEELARALGRRLVDPAAGQAAYRIRGSMARALAQCAPAARVDFVLQEIGTYPPIVVLHALREENRCHHYGAADPRHPARLALLEALCPASPRWRALAVERGLSLLRAAAAWAFGRS